MSDTIMNEATSAHDFPTSESQQVLEHRKWHDVAASLMKKIVDLEKSVLTNSVELVEAEGSDSADEVHNEKGTGWLIIGCEGQQCLEEVQADQCLYY